MTENSTPPLVAALRVDCAHLEQGFRVWARVKKLGRSTATFSFANGELHVAAPSYQFRASAEGTWPGTATVQMGDLRRIAKEWSRNSGQIELTVVVDRLRMGGFVLGCRWIPE